MKFSYSRVNCFKQCPYQYNLKYIEQLKTLPNFEANNALHLGSCMHTGLEKDVDVALAQYFSYFPLIDDLQINEAIKLEYIIPLAKKMIPAGESEVHVETDSFQGFIDRLVPKGGNHFDMYEFKYASGIKYEPVYEVAEDQPDIEEAMFTTYYEQTGFKPSPKLQGYFESVQLHVYKYFYELTHPGHVIDNLYYVFLPKIQIRQKNSKKEQEDLFQFRQRIIATLGQSEVLKFRVEYDPQKVGKYLAAVEEIKAATEFPKNCTRLCDWCEYKQYCKEGDTTMITMPKIERRKAKPTNKRRIWLYGKPMTGKTFFANKFPEPLMLNTDDNTDFVDATVLSIKDQVTYKGNVDHRTSAWEYFIEAVDMLEREQNNPERPKTVIVDVLDQVFNSCQEHVLKQAKLTHESDAGFGKGYALVRRPFIQQIKRLLLLDYENIILISHEDDASNVTNRDGSQLTKFKTTLPDAVANAISSLVKVIARVHLENGERKLTFPKDSLLFGGIRLQFARPTIPLSYTQFMQAYDTAVQKMTESKTETAAQPATQAAAPVRRTVQ